MSEQQTAHRREDVLPMKERARCTSRFDFPEQRTGLPSHPAADDRRTLMSHAIVEEPMYGAVAQGARQVFSEHGVYHLDSGQFLTAASMMPQAGRDRRINAGDEPLLNALGAKGGREGGCGGSLPALTVAVAAGLGAMGAQHLDMPLTPNRGWHAIQKAKQRR